LAPDLVGGRRAPTNWFLAYGALIILAQAVLAVVNVAIGVVVLGFVLVLLTTHIALARPPRDPVLPALSLVPLISLLGVAMTDPNVHPALVYVLAGSPVLVGTVLVSRAIGASARDLGLRRPRSPVLTVLTVGLGIPLGLAARDLVGLAPIDLDDSSLLLSLAIAIPFVVVLEEVVFRGLLQHVAMARSLALAVVAPNVLYASVYFGSGSTLVVLFMGLTGTIFSLAVARTGTLWGVLGAHLILRILVQV
jgi:membrane protease YdiL (CAAX protease family)